MATLVGRVGVFHDNDQHKRCFITLNEQRNCSQFCDVVLNVCNTQIHAHSNILAAASPYFRSILGVGTDCPRVFSSKQPQVIEIHIDSNSKDGDGGYGEAVSKVIEFMYTSYIVLTPTLVSQITEIGKIMQIEKLLHFCEAFHNGVNDNCPQSVLTCTTGLEEIANLLGNQSKGAKRVSVATETDLSIFRKTDDFSLKLELDQTLDSLPIMPDGENENSVIESPAMDYDSMELKIEHTSVTATDIDAQTSSNKVVLIEDKEDAEMISEQDETIHSPPPTNIGFDTTMEQEQTDASLLLSIGKARMPTTGNVSDCDSNADFFRTDSIELSSATASKDIVETQTPVSLKGVDSHASDYIKTIAAMISSNITDVKSETQDNALLNSVKTLDEPLSLSSQVHQDQLSTVEVSSVDTEKLLCSSTDRPEEKSINFEEISNLVRFDPVTTAMYSSFSQSPKDGGNKGTLARSRGRPRGRGRGRGRKRGRGVGRPRKVVVEKDSDPEFEEFIEKLERGDNVLAESEKNVKSLKQQSAVSDSEVGSESTSNTVKDANVDPAQQVKDGQSQDICSQGKWKSKRRRITPSQLRKDYIVHSLTRKSHRNTQNSQERRCEENSTQRRPLPVESTKSSSTPALTFVCEKCDFTTSVIKDYRQHLKAHPETDPRYFVCEKCDFRTIKAREYKLHKQKHLIDDLICPLCEYQCASETDFQGHSAKHEGDCPFFCTECDSKFRTKNQLIAHRPKHQLEKPFVCVICSAGFKWKHALKNHMITHSASKDHLCDVCGFATAHKSQLKAHHLIHTGHTFKCPVSGCSFQATKRQNLKYHMVTHTNEKPHQCEICGQSFSLLKNMRRHKLLHTDTRPYSCKVCVFSTTRYDKLKDHILKSHSVGEQPATRKTIVPIDIAYISSDGITINQISTNGSISEETLQKIAQLATAQQNSEHIDILDHGLDESTAYPIIATVHQHSEQSDQFVAEVVKAEHFES